MNSTRRQAAAMTSPANLPACHGRARKFHQTAGYSRKACAASISRGPSSPACCR